MITATLFLVFAVITILGMPIALALVGGGMAAIVAGDLMPLFTSVQKMFSSVDSFTLAAIPFFMLAGALDEQWWHFTPTYRFCQCCSWLDARRPRRRDDFLMYAVWLFVRLPTATVAGHRRSDGACAEQGGYSRKIRPVHYCCSRYVGHDYSAQHRDDHILLRNGCIGGQYVHGRNCSRHHAGCTDDCLCDFLRRKKSDP